MKRNLTMETLYPKSKQRILVIAILTSISSAQVFANSDELENLKKEVQELRTLLEQNMETSNRVQTQLNQQITEPSPYQTAKNIFQTKSGAQFELYGILRADAIYQMNGSDAVYNNINKVPLNGTVDAAKQKNTLKSSVNVTRFGLNFNNPTLDSNVGGKLELDFFGGSTRDQFRIRHAYLTYNHWLIGQTWSTFITPEYTPEVLDAGTYVGGSLQRSPLIRYSNKINGSTNYAVSLEHPQYTTATDPDGKTKYPVLAGKIYHRFSDQLELAGRSFVTKKVTSSDELFSWGVGLGGKYQITPKLLLKSDYYHVKGDGKFINWSNVGYAIDNNKNIYANEFDSFTAGLTYKFTPKLRSNIGAGYMIADDNNQFSKINYSANDQNKSLWQGWINALYSPVKPITFGAEYVYGERETFNEQKGKDQRLNFMATYEF